MGDKASQEDVAELRVEVRRLRFQADAHSLHALLVGRIERYVITLLQGRKLRPNKC